MVEILLLALTVAGLSLFEIVSSIDNAVINADVLSTMSKRARRWFLIYGIFIAVFVIRGLLPFAIIYGLNPGLGPVGAFTAAFSNDPAVAEAVKMSAPPLLAGGGVFLLFLFFRWLFLEPKFYGLWGEKFIHKRGFWFYAFVSITLSLIVWFAIHANPLMAFGATVGASIFFITQGFKDNAEAKEKEMIEGSGNMSDVAKLMYLEVIDASFSLDGVLGAFAFTLSVPLILIGNGIGAVVLRKITVSNIDNVKRYKYLKNGAMYAIGILGVIMLIESFGHELPMWLSPTLTIAILAYFFFKSRRALKLEMKK
jgi:hypothetical protein